MEIKVSQKQIGLARRDVDYLYEYPLLAEPRP